MFVAILSWLSAISGCNCRMSTAINPTWQICHMHHLNADYRAVMCTFNARLDS